MCIGYIMLAQVHVDDFLEKLGAADFGIHTHLAIF